MYGIKRSRKYNKTVLLISIIISVVLLWSCDDDNGTDPSYGDGTSAKISGRVTNDTGYGSGLQKTNAGVEGAVVTVAEIQADGSLETVSTAEVQTDAQGEFEIESTVSGKSDLVIVAVKGSSEWKAVVSSEVQAGSENYSQPLNDETTVEAEIYAEIKSNGEADIVTYNDVAFYIDSEIAAAVKSNSSLMTEIKNSIVAEAEAELDVLTGADFGYSDTEIESKKQAEINAQAELESVLYFGNDSESSQNQAWSNYFQAVIEGYANTEISFSDYAKAKEISGKSMLNLSSNLDSDLRFELQKRNAYLKAVLITEAVVEQYDSAEAEEPRKLEAREEGNSLKASIRTAGSINAVNEAFAEFGNNIKAHLKSTFSADSSALASIEAVIEGSLKTTLTAAITSAAGINAVIDGYTSFYAEIDSTVNSNVSMENDAKLKAYSNIYALIYMHN